MAFISKLCGASRMRRGVRVRSENPGFNPCHIFVQSAKYALKLSDNNQKMTRACK